MRKLMFFVLFALVLQACEKDVEGIDSCEYVTCNISVGGELDVSYLQMTRADNNNSHRLYIVVYAYNSQQDKYEKYVEKAFDNTTNETIELIKGGKYKICASYVAKEYYYDTYGFLCTGKVFRKPFFIYNMPTERYYCETITDVINGNETIILNMKNCSSKLYMAVGNLLAGNVKAVIDMELSGDDNVWEPKRTIITDYPQNNSASIVFAFRDATLSWNNDDYTESYNVSFYYTIGDAEELIATKNLTFKRNTITNVDIILNNSSLGENGHNLSVNWDGDYQKGETVRIDYEL